MIIAKSTPSKVYKTAQTLSCILSLVLLIILAVALSQGQLTSLLPLLLVEILLVTYLGYMYFGQITSISVNDLELLVNTRIAQIVIPCSSILAAGYDKADQVPFIQLIGVKMFPGGLLRFFSSDYKSDRFYITNEKQVFYVKTPSKTYHISNDKYQEMILKINDILSKNQA